MAFGRRRTRAERLDGADHAAITLEQAVGNADDAEGAREARQMMGQA